MEASGSWAKAGSGGVLGDSAALTAPRLWVLEDRESGSGGAEGLWTMGAARNPCFLVALSLLLQLA